MSDKEAFVMPSRGEREVGVTIRVDGREIIAGPGQLLIDACSEAGIYIPHFCYHPRMSPVGMCRMCIVEVDSGRGPALMASCTLPVAENMEVSTESTAVKNVQDGVLEFLLLNHPLDCPVCDKGGECPLQDQTMAFGPGESRFVEDKRHFVKPIPISSQVYLDRERCILCDRCTRFADEVAGDALINFQGRGQHLEVNTFPDSEFSSYFSGNTVQICPVGALTAEPYRFKARPWDLNETSSTYPNPMGDRVVIQSSNNKMVRILGLDSEAVNWGWLTDKDRFGFQALESPNRIRTPLKRTPEESAGGKYLANLAETSWYEALSMAAEMVKTTLVENGPESLAVLGGANMANEDQYVWAKLAKAVWGTDNVDSQVGDGLPPKLIAGLPRPSLAEALRPGSVVLLFGTDPKEELGTLYLRLRHAVINDGVQLIEISQTPTGLSHLAQYSFGVLAGASVEAVESLIAGTGDFAAAHKLIAQATTAAGNFTTIFGRASLAEAAEVSSTAIFKLAKAYPNAGFLPVLRHGNIFGAIDMGLSPGMLPGRRNLESANTNWQSLPKHVGKSGLEVLADISSGRITTLFLLGEDPLTSCPDAELLSQALSNNPNLNIVALAKFATPFIEKFADLVMPTMAWGERSGTHTNLEGRVSIQNQLISPPGTARCEWEIAVELSRLTSKNVNAPLLFTDLEEIWSEIRSLSIHDLSFQAVAAAEDGLIPKFSSEAMSLEDVSLEDVSFEGMETTPTPIPTPTQKAGDSYKLVAQRPMYDGDVWTMECESLAKLGPPDPVLKLNPSELERLGITSGSNVEVRHANVDKPSVILPVVADESVPPQAVVMTSTQPPNIAPTRPDAAQLIDSRLIINEIYITPAP